MKGTEKQIRFAESIIAEAEETIRRNIETNQERYEKTHYQGYADFIAQWKATAVVYRKKLERYGDDAERIILNRNMIGSEAVVDIWNDIGMKLQLGKITREQLEEFAK